MSAVTVNLAYHEDAEMSALGCALIGASGTAVIVQRLRPEMFALPAHQEILAGIQSVAKSGLRVELLSVRIELAKLGTLEMAGGESYLLNLAEYAVSGDESAAEMYAAQVLDAFSRRERIRFAQEIRRLSISGGSDAEVQTAITNLAKIGEAKVLATPICDVDFETDDEGCTTGYTELDKATEVGFPAGQTTIVAAFAKSGKSSMMLSCASRLCEGMGRVLYATFADLDPRAIKKRLVRAQCGFGRRPQDMFMADDFDAAIAKVNSWDLDIYYGPKQGMSVEKLSQYVRTAHRAQRYDAVFVDYIQRVAAEAKEARESSTRRMEYISSELAALAAVLEIPVIAGSQVTIDAKGKWMTKYAAAIAEDAGLVIKLATELTPETTEVLVEIPFNRFGPAGRCFVKWNPRRVRFDDL